MTGTLASNISVANPRGFSLVEVLVALFLQAIGMLGMTALQVKALKSTHAALIDLHVQYLLADMAERLHGNPGAAYAIAYTDGTPAAINDCAVVVCSSSELASWDVREWREKIEDNGYLPEGEGQISFNNLTQTYEISVRYTWSQLASIELVGSKRTVSLVTSELE